MTETTDDLLQGKEPKLNPEKFDVISDKSRREEAEEERRMFETNIPSKVPAFEPKLPQDQFARVKAAREEIADLDGARRERQQRRGLEENLNLRPDPSADFQPEKFINIKDPANMDLSTDRPTGGHIKDLENMDLPTSPMQSLGDIKESKPIPPKEEPK